MAHVLTREAAPSTSSAPSAPAAPEEAKKQRKRVAKQEAKLMLRLEEARQGVEKAEQKEARAHEKLNARLAQLQQLQEQLTALRMGPGPQEAPDGHAAASVSPEAGAAAPAEVPQEAAAEKAGNPSTSTGEMSPAAPQA